MLNKARKLMEQRESMIADAREVLVVLGAEEMGATIVRNEIVINKGKVVAVEVPVVKEIVKEVVKEVEVEVEVVKEVQVQDTELQAAYDKLAEDFKNRCERIEDLKQQMEDNADMYEHQIELLTEKANKNYDKYMKALEKTAQLEIQIAELQKALATKADNKPAQEIKITKETKVVRNNKLVKCGPNTGENEILFIEKRRDNKHLWYGQVRIDNVIRNFHWSNELQKPVVYGVESLASLATCNELIRQAVSNIDSKELTKYDMVPDHPEFGGFKARHYYGALAQGAYIYMTPDAQAENGKDEDIVFKGYVNKHAFVVWRNGEIRFRHYDYINSTKPFEKTPSKGFNAEQMAKDIETLAETVLAQYDKAASKVARQHSKDNQVETQVEAPQDDNKVKYDANAKINHDLANADIGGLF